MWDVTTRCRKLSQRLRDELVEDLFRRCIGQVECSALQFRDNDLLALRVLIRECIGNRLPRIYCVDASVAVEFDNDAEAMLNAKQIGGMHCERRFTGSGVAENPENIASQLGHVSCPLGNKLDEIHPSTVQTA